MLFNSNIFLLAFLPAALLTYYLLRQNFGANAAVLSLLFFSLLFYSYWEPMYLPILLLSIFVNYYLGKYIARGHHRLLWVGVAFNLLILGFFKYANFMSDNVAALTNVELGFLSLALPIGISFYTFQQIAFLADAKTSQVHTRNFVSYGLFVSFFPQLIAGPIVHHREMMPQFSTKRSGNYILYSLCGGVLMLSIGLFKKCMIADNLATVATPIFARAVDGTDLNFFVAWVGAFAYTFQIYFDFSGYSDMAIGLALMFGIKLPTNFNSPYKSLSIIDFWRSWHMTLSRFLRDYLYIPLGGRRRGPWRRYVNLAIVMLLGGLWHGAAWTFVIWGALHGLYLMVNHGWRRTASAVGISAILPARLACVISWGLTFLAIVVAWVVFRAESLDGALRMYESMFLLKGLALPLEAEPLIRHLGMLGQIPIEFFAEESRADFYLGMLLIMVAGAIAVFAPNSLQLTQSFRPTVDFDQVSEAWGNSGKERPAAAQHVGQAPFGQLLGRGLRVAPYAAAVSAVLLFSAFRAINAAAPSEFLYFQF